MNLLKQRLFHCFARIYRITGNDCQNLNTEHIKTSKILMQCEWYHRLKLYQQFVINMICSISLKKKYSIEQRYIYQVWTELITCISLLIIHYDKTIFWSNGEKYGSATVADATWFTGWVRPRGIWQLNI